MLIMALLVGAPTVAVAAPDIDSDEPKCGVVTLDDEDSDTLEDDEDLDDDDAIMTLEKMPDEDLDEEPETTCGCLASRGEDEDD